MIIAILGVIFERIFTLDNRTPNGEQLVHLSFFILQMATKSATLRIRMTPDLKEGGDKVLSEIGINPSDAVTMFYRQVVMHQGLPFDAKIPNQTTIDAFNEDLSDAKRYDSIDELMSDLDNDV